MRLTYSLMEILAFRAPKKMLELLSSCKKDEMSQTPKPENSTEKNLELEECMIQAVEFSVYLQQRLLYYLGAGRCSIAVSYFEMDKAGKDGNKSSWRILQGFIQAHFYTSAVRVEHLISNKAPPVSKIGAIFLST